MTGELGIEPAFGELEDPEEGSLHGWIRAPYRHAAGLGWGEGLALRWQIFEIKCIHLVTADNHEVQALSQILCGLILMTILGGGTIHTPFDG